jgi:hypothetical protein
MAHVAGISTALSGPYSSNGVDITMNAIVDPGDILDLPAGANNIVLVDNTSGVSQTVTIYGVRNKFERNNNITQVVAAGERWIGPVLRDDADLGFMQAGHKVWVGPAVAGVVVGMITWD